MKVKYLIEEEIKILRQGIIELEVNDLSNDDDITARRIDIKDNSTYLKRLPIREC